MSGQYRTPAPSAGEPAGLGPLFTANSEQPAANSAELSATRYQPLAICPVPETEALVYSAISACRGRKAAISMTAVAAHAGCDTRTVQTLIAHLIDAHHCPIGSATGGRHGYFWIVDAEDLLRAKTQLAHRIIETARRLRALDKNALADVMGQITLELTNSRT